MRESLREVAQKLGQPGASQRAAELIAEVRDPQIHSRS